MRIHKTHSKWSLGGTQAAFSLFPRQHRAENEEKRLTYKTIKNVKFLPKAMDFSAGWV